MRSRCGLSRNVTRHIDQTYRSAGPDTDADAWVVTRYDESKGGDCESNAAEHPRPSLARHRSSRNGTRHRHQLTEENGL